MPVVQFWLGYRGLSELQKPAEDVLNADHLQWVEFTNSMPEALSAAHADEFALHIRRFAA